MMTPRIAIVLPAYNHAATVAEVARKALGLHLPVFVVDDGSTDDTPGRLAQVPGICRLRHPFNRGKGAALITGFKAAAAVADWAIALDADGQHDPADAARLIAAIPPDAHPNAQRPLIVGRRMGMTHDRAPWTSRFGRGFSNFWVFASGGPRLTDSQSGFRLYPLPETLHLTTRSRRYQFEVEILVAARQKGMPVIEVPVPVFYPQGAARISHFHPFFDFLRNSGTFSRLIFHRLTSAGKRRR